MQKTAGAIVQRVVEVTEEERGVVGGLDGRQLHPFHRYVRPTRRLRSIRPEAERDAGHSGQRNRGGTKDEFGDLVVGSQTRTARFDHLLGEHLHLVPLIPAQDCHHHRAILSARIEVTQLDDQLVLELCGQSTKDYT